MVWTCCLLWAAGSSFCHFERLVFLAGIFFVVVFFFACKGVVLNRNYSTTLYFPFFFIELHAIEVQVKKSCREINMLFSV